MIDAFSQLASTSAVLGGFAFAFLGAIISGSRQSRAITVTAGFTLPAAAAFILCALGWSLSTVWMGSPLNQSRESLPEFLVTLHATLSPVFLVGIGAFLAALGTSGWIYSRKLGYLSATVAVAAAAGSVVIIQPFLVAQ